MYIDNLARTMVRFANMLVDFLREQTFADSAVTVREIRSLLQFGTRTCFYVFYCFFLLFAVCSKFTPMRLALPDLLGLACICSRGPRVRAMAACRRRKDAPPKTSSSADEFKPDTPCSAEARIGAGINRR